VNLFTIERALEQDVCGGTCLAKCPCRTNSERICGWKDNNGANKLPRLILKVPGSHSTTRTVSLVSEDVFQ
jgi:hypothetical protein